MDKLKKMRGLTLLEVMLACFILTSSTLAILTVLLQQRVILHHLCQQVLELQLLKTVKAELQASHTMTAWDRIIADWKIQVSNSLPLYKAKTVCETSACHVCIVRLNREERQCLFVTVAGLPSLN